MCLSKNLFIVGCIYSTQCINLNTSSKFGLKQAKGNTRLQGICDADWASGKEKKVDLLPFMLKIPKAWDSRKQYSVGLLSIADEYVSVRTAALEFV